MRFSFRAEAAAATLGVLGFVLLAALPAHAQASVQPTLNPAPARGYEIEFRFAGLPGAITGVVAFAHFEVGNVDCVALDHSRALGGVRLPPEHRFDLPLEQRGAGVYVTKVYEDALASADLFGLGDCHWRMDSVTMNFRSPATLFVGGAGTDKLRSATPVVQHYLARDFAEKPKYTDHVFGEKPDHYLKSLGPQFTLTTTPRRLP